MPAGFTAQAVWNNGGTWATPTWEIIQNIRDVTVNNSHTDIDASSRRGGGFMEHALGLRDGTVDFQMLWRVGPVGTDTAFDAISSAFLNRTLIDMWFVDGDHTVAGNEGLRANFLVVTFTRNEPIDDIMTVDVSVAPGEESADPPEWKVAP